jgi:hypothetical protein
MVDDILFIAEGEDGTSVHLPSKNKAEDYVINLKLTCVPKPNKKLKKICGLSHPIALGGCLAIRITPKQQKTKKQKNKKQKRKQNSPLGLAIRGGRSHPQTK